MTIDMRSRILTGAINQYQAGRISRRQLIRSMGGLGLAAAGAMALERSTAAQQAGTPAAAATAQIGQRADGTTLWHVKVGHMDMEDLLDLQAFFPTEITINAGDGIWFEFPPMPGFHSVTFTSGQQVPLIIPDPEAATPTAGPPQMVLNPDVVLPGGGDSYDGTGLVNSGVDVFRDPGQPYVLNFTKAGTYDYVCIPHASVMKAKVIVQEAGAALPYDQAAYDQMAAEQADKLTAGGQAKIKEYQEAKQTKRDDGTTLWEATVGAEEGQARVQQFLPNQLEVTVGDTVKWVHRAPGEPHTVSFIGQGETPPEDTLVGQFADGRPKFSINQLTLLPQGGNTWSGKGWVNSGYMGIAELGLPTDFELTFDTPGEWTYYCVLHGDAQGNGMAAKIKVSPKA